MSKLIVKFVSALLVVSSAYATDFSGSYCGSAKVFSENDFVMSPQETTGCVEIVQNSSELSIKDCWELRVINRSYDKMNLCVSTDLILKDSELFFKGEGEELYFVGKIIGNELTGTLNGVELRIKKNQNKSLDFYRSSGDGYIREAFYLNMR